MRLLILGDIVGMPGLLAIRQQLPKLRERFTPDLVLANAENVSNGTGITPNLYKKLLEAGIDGMTLGDHCYKKNHILPILEKADNLIRPANLSPHALGGISMLLRPREDLPPVYVFTVLGRIMMNMPANDPFAAADAMIERRPDPDAIIIVEIHAETTSEKVAMGWHLNGRAAVVFGTHTHIPTRDARILPEGVPNHDTAGGTAYISDLGMCGPVDSVLGRRVDRVLKHMITNMPAPFDVAEGNPQVQGIFVEISRKNRATAIEPFTVCADPGHPPFVD